MVCVHRPDGDRVASADTQGGYQCLEREEYVTSINEQRLREMRKEYSDRPLCEEAMTDDPFPFFEFWFKEAVDAQLYEPNAMVLSTVGIDGYPTSRAVLLKGANHDGFVFFTNYSSRKGRELAERPAASLLFLWAELHRQVRIEGTVSRVSREESEEYFAQRPRGAQIGAWASEQSERLHSRGDLEQRVAELEKRFGESVIPCPPYWGGYRLLPLRIEFWQGRRSRLHDRIVYERGVNAWTQYRLAP
jgi:pyridoxamine 5'-phosphate oxidase